MCLINRYWLYSDFDKLNAVVTELEDYNIGIDVSLPEECFSQKISNSKLTQTQSDKLLDTQDTSELNTPNDINKQITHEDQDTYIHTLLIYGSCFKNLELLPRQEKEKMYNDFILGLCIMLGILKKALRSFLMKKFLIWNYYLINIVIKKLII